MPKRVQRMTRTDWLMAGAVLLWTAVLATYAILRYQRLNATAYDLAIQSQVIWNTGHGRFFASTLEVNNYLGDHVQPILLLLAPFYRLWPRPELLLIIQAFALSVGAIPVYRLAGRHLGNKRLALLFGLIFLLYPNLGFMNRFDFHLVTFSIPFLLFAFNAWDESRLATANLFLLLALFSKEEIGLTIFALGLYALLVRKQIKVGALWAGVGLGWSLLALFVIIPAFRGADSDTLARYAWLGDGPVAQLRTLLFQPAVVWQHLSEPLRGQFLLRLLLPLGYLSLLAPAVLLIGLPALAYNLLSAVPSQSSIYFHYLAPFIPFAFIAAMLGAAWLGPRIGPHFPRLVAVWLVLGTAVAWLLDNPFTRPIGDPYFPVYGLERLLDPAPFAEARQLLPDDASVATTMAFAPHLSTRPKVDLFYHKGKREAQVYDYPPADYLLLHLNDFRWGENPRVYAAMIETAVGRDGYEAIFYRDDVVLLQRGAPASPATGAMLQRLQQLAEAGGKFAPTGPDTVAWIQQRWQTAVLPPDATPQTTTFDNGLTFLGYRMQPTAVVSGGALCITLYWQAETPSVNPTHIFLHLAAGDGYVHAQRDTSGVLDFYPPSEWPAATIIGDLHCLTIPAGLPGGTYQLHAGLYDATTGQRAVILSSDVTQTDFVHLTDVTVSP
jgi:uncharacterized membrane protein